jgi:hypothetical protein
VIFGASGKTAAGSTPCVHEDWKSSIRPGGKP